jgi:hypothetical protein
VLPCASVSDLGFTAHPVVLQMLIRTTLNSEDVSSGARTVSIGQSEQCRPGRDT